MILGIVQGLTEFVPISSTAHLKVIPMLLGWGDPGLAVSAVIQLGSICAVFIYFKRDLERLLEGITRAIRNDQWREDDARLGVAIFIVTLPILFVGVLI